ncbi:MAG: 4Fe-4S binding protein [Bacteroidales bacterium]|nr:4Fe-4S binding protein [Bacteroidales bacterium]
MNKNTNHKLVYTIKERCRVCYTCVRECPAKAIRINNGQAEVIHERCIGCGNCIKVCSQNAKTFVRNDADVLELLNGSNQVFALLAPSFPVEFCEVDNYKKVLGAIKKLGFSKIIEVAFGAELVARKYKELYQNENSFYITSDCPAVTFFVRQYYPELTVNLAPIVSPMVATARAVKKYYGQDVKLVFIGPCISKKVESNEVDVAITYKELRSLFNQKHIVEDECPESDFDYPKAYKATVFPINFGLSQTMGRYYDLFENKFLVAQGKEDMQQAIKWFSDESHEKKNLELLCCEGCIMGPGITNPIVSKFVKQNLLISYARQRLNETTTEEFEQTIQAFSGIDLSTKFTPQDRRIAIPSYDEIDKVLRKMEKKTASDMLNCGACGYATCIDHAIAIIEGIAETEMCLPYTIESLHKSVKDLALTNDKLSSAQIALRQAEKLAHMGQLSAGIAHELNNPLGVIIMYCNLLLEECPPDSPMRKDLELIVEQGNRCKKIVSGLLNFARRNQVNATETDLYALTEKALEAVLIPDFIKTNIQADRKPMLAIIDADQILQVLINLIRNAADAITHKSGIIDIFLTEEPNYFVIKVKDNGTGIAEENKAKLFEPFFTTKPIGVGNGLGLPIVYGIVKMHKGIIEVETNDDVKKGPTGTTFIVKLPKN